MEQLIVFNGVKILLTTGQNLYEIQNFTEENLDVILSVNPEYFKVLKQP